VSEGRRSRRAARSRLPWQGWLLGAWLLLATAVAAAQNLIPNGDFRQADGTRPALWNLDAAVRGKGEVRLVDLPGGGSGRAVELRPNARNGGARPLGLGQVIDAKALRGQRLTLSALLAAEGGATAIVGLHALGAKGDLGHVQLMHSTPGAPQPQRGTLEVPAAADVLILYLAAGGQEGRALFSGLVLEPAASAAAAGPVRGAAPGTAPATSAATTAATTATTAATASYSAALVVQGSALRERVPSALFGINVEWIFDGQGLWDARAQRVDPEAKRLTRELGTTLLRWPGGVFSDTYRWRDGMGPQAQRPTTQHFPKGPRSRHSFGTPEVAELAQAAGADLLITVNAGTGTAAEAADWVRHMNLGPGPKVQWWEVGNELYMQGDLAGAHMSADAYAKRFLEFAAAMRAVDPGIRVGAIGGLNYGRYAFVADPRWTEKLLRVAAPQMDYLAVHNAYAPVLMGAPVDTDPRAAYRAMLAAPVLIEANLRDLDALLARHERRDRRIGLAVTEWGPLWHALPDSPWVDHVKTWGSALFTASTLHAFLRQPRVEMATAFKLADQGFMGWLGRRDGRWMATPSAQVFAMYTRLAGQQLLSTRTETPGFDTDTLGVVQAVRNAPWLEAVAAASPDCRELTLMLVNRHETEAADLRIELPGVRGWREGRQETLVGRALDAHVGTALPAIPGIRWAEQKRLSRFGQGSPDELQRSAEKLPAARAGTLQRRLPPLSVTALTLVDVQR
jgi:alpha-N-arabinofuranosidase